MKDYMQAVEVARLFRVSSKTISRWARDGVFVDGDRFYLEHTTTLGGHRRYKRTMVLELARARGILAAELAAPVEEAS
jgi:DNA-binding transcriptional MerR regulator